MGDDSTAALRRFREEHAQVFAMLWRRLGELDLVDTALADAYYAALASWPAGIPSNPATWMATVALSATTGVVSRRGGGDAEPAHPVDDLRSLLWTCCHPTLAPEERTACLGRAAAGLMPAELAELLGVSDRTITARLDSAKTVLRQPATRAAVADAERADRTALVAATIAVLRTGAGPDAAPVAALLDAHFARAFPSAPPIV